MRAQCALTCGCHDSFALTAEECADTGSVNRCTKAEERSCGNNADFDVSPHEAKGTTAGQKRRSVPVRKAGPLNPKRRLRIHVMLAV